MPSLKQVWIRTCGYEGTEWIRADTIASLYVADGNFEIQSLTPGGYLSGRLHVSARISGRDTPAVFAEGFTGKQDAFEALRLLFSTLTKVQDDLNATVEVFHGRVGQGLVRWNVQALS